jgi:hypothetical protein
LTKLKGIIIIIKYLRDESPPSIPRTKKLDSLLENVEILGRDWIVFHPLPVSSPRAHLFPLNQIKSKPATHSASNQPLVESQVLFSGCALVPDL